MVRRVPMSKPNLDKDDKEEKFPDTKEKKDSPANSDAKKPSRLAERKGQRPAFPFKRKPV